MNDKKRQFIVGLEKLTRETGIAIGGCGCCGSPFLYEVESHSEDSAGYGFGYNWDLMWISPSYVERWYKHRDSIVKEK